MTDIAGEKMTLDLEALKRELEDISNEPWRITIMGLQGASPNGFSFILKASEYIAAVIAEVERANELLETRWNESTDHGMRLVNANDELQEKLKQAEKRIRELERGELLLVYCQETDKKIKTARAEAFEEAARLAGKTTIAGAHPDVAAMRSEIVEKLRQQASAARREDGE